MEELDDAGTYYNMGLRRITIAGMYNFMCTRNNNFSNRSQKGRFGILILKLRLLSCLISSVVINFFNANKSCFLIPGRIVVTKSPFVAKKVGMAGGDIALPNGDASLQLDADALSRFNLQHHRALYYLC